MYLPFLPFTFSRHGVVAATTPRVTSQNAPDSQSETLDRTMFHDGLLGILATGGSKSARRSQQRRDAYLVKPDGQNQ